MKAEVWSFCRVVCLGPEKLPCQPRDSVLGCEASLLHVPRQRSFRRAPLVGFEVGPRESGKNDPLYIHALGVTKCLVGSPDGLGVLGNFSRIPIAADRPGKHQVESFVDPEPPPTFRRVIPAPIVRDAARYVAPVSLPKFSDHALSVLRCSVAIVETESPDRYDGPVVLTRIAVRVRKFQVTFNRVPIVTQYPLGQILPAVAGNVVHDVEREAASLRCAFEARSDAVPPRAALSIEGDGKSGARRRSNRNLASIEYAG